MARTREVAALLLLALLVLPASSALARPGDLSLQVSVSPTMLEARPTDVAATVILQGNVSFEQPAYQRATADMTVTVDRNWTAVATPSRLVNRGPGMQMFTVAVTVPTTALAGEVATVIVTAAGTTRVNTAANATATALVRVLPWSGYEVEAPDPIEVATPQDSEATISFKVRNVGNLDERYSVSAPYWFGLQRYGLVVDAPAPVPVRAHQEAAVIVHVTVQAAVVPRVYEVQLLIDAMSMESGGSGPGGDPRWVRAWVNVSGLAPPGDRYATWSLGGGPDTVPEWRALFGSPESRSAPDVDAAGRHVVYSQLTGEGAAIQVGAIDGSGSDQLTRGDADDTCPVISPDGQRIAFLRDGHEVIVMSVNGTELDSMETDLEGVTLTDWAPIGDLVLLTSGGDIHELNLVTGGTRTLASEPVWQWGATYSPDGGRIYYLSLEAAGRTSEVWSMAPDGSDHRQITFNDLDERTVSVSPNGQRLAFSLQDTASALDRLCVVSREGTGAKWVTAGRERLDAVRWLPDGQGLVAQVALGGGGSTDVMRLDYPWSDAGTGGGDGDGGGGGGGSGGAGDGPLKALSNPYAMLGIALLVVLVVVPLAYRRRERARRSQAATLLKAQRARGAHPATDAAADVATTDGGILARTGGTTPDPLAEFRMGYKVYDGAQPPAEGPPAMPRVARRADGGLDYDTV